MDVQKTLVKSLDLVFKENNFKKKVNHWYFYWELILKINLQKSYYGDVFYINLDIFFNNWEKNYFPNYPQQFSTRLDHILTNLRIEKEFRFEWLTEKEINDKINYISLLIKDNINILKDLSNIDQFKKYINTNKNYLLSSELKNKLNT